MRLVHGNARQHGPQDSLSALLGSAVDAIVIIDQSGTIQRVSASASRLFGYDEEEFIGRNIKFLMTDEHRGHHDGYLQNYLTSGRCKIIGIGREVEGQRKDGSIFAMHLSVGEYEQDGEKFFTGIIHDLTERKASEAVLREAQKIDAMGQLTGGVAHDFNNLLAVILGNLELLQERADLGANAVLVREAMKAADLGASLTARLLAFARRSPLSPEVVQVNDLVTGILPLLQRTLGGSVELSLSLDPEAWAVRIDPAQFQTALVNLAVNARDAMPGGGRLVIETRNLPLDERFTGDGLGLDLGQYVTVSLTDTGIGMSEEVKNRVFEPFFTTKAVGRGTGLGLSMVYGFAKQSGGEVTIYSELGTGTTVSLNLPRHSATDVPVQPPKTPTRRAAGETVLVVEDNDQVRRLARMRLEVLGYRVHEAVNGPEAMTVMSRAKVDLVFTDLVMPGGMSGYDVARAVQTDYPGVRVLLTSGYAEELINGDRLATANLRLLRKPYSQQTLAEALRLTLETAR